MFDSGTAMSLAHLALTTQAQIAAFSHPIRQQILRLVAQQPLTNKQIADRLQSTPPRTYHHVRELERAGLIRLVRQVPVGGVVEKYYKAVAVSFSLTADVSHAPGPTAIASSALSAAQQELIARSQDPTTAPLHVHVLNKHVWLNIDERNRVEDLISEVSELLNNAARRQATPPDAAPVNLLVLFYAPAKASEQREH